MHFHYFISTNSLCILSVFFWCVVLATADVYSTEKNVDLNDHLTRKLREARVTIVKEYTKVEDDGDPVITVSYDVEWEKIGSEVLDFSEPRLVVRIMDKMFILEGNRTLSVNVKSVSNETSYVALLAQPAFLRQGRSVKLAKSIVWKSRLYLLVCEEDECTLYIGENDSRLEHEQSLNHRGMFDATFFTRDNRLYLLVTHHKTDQFLGSSTIYHWTGTYMDIIQPIETVGDVLVTAFNYGRATIMVFGQPSSDIGLEIYEYYNNRIERISYLPSNGPISVIHYHHDGFDFLLIVNKQEASSVYWWDGAGREFIHWFDLLDIVSPSKVIVAQLGGDTFLFVSYESSVCLYKVSRPKYTRLDILDFKATGEKIIDMEVKVDENAKLLTLIVVTFDPFVNQYRIEPWKLYIKKNHKINADIRAGVDTTVECLSELLVKLNDRMIAMENLTQNIWPQLLSSEADNTVTGSFVLQKLILGSHISQNAIKIGSIEIDTLGIEAELLLPNEMEKALTTTSMLVSSVLNDSRKTLKIYGDDTLTGNVIVTGDTKFANLRTKSIRTSNFNGHEMKLQNFSHAAITATKNQIFPNSTLRGKNITVRHLKIDQLCGIPFKYWLRVENAASDNIFNSHNLTDVTMKNDTVLLESKRGVLTTSFGELPARSIDGLNIENFLNQLFIPGERQNIKGNILQKIPGETTIRIENLAAEKLNDIPAKSLLTINTDQNITGHVYFPAKMLWKNVVTKKINGIDIADFAMVSKKNYFRGELTVAKMRVSNRLVIENPKKFSLDAPVQIYNSVTVVGNARVKNIEFQRGAKSSFPALLSNVKNRYWTKSTRQTIKNSVIFEKGLKVDELRVKSFNNLDPDNDILTTNAREISAELNSLRFKNFTVKHFVRESAAGENSSSIIPPDGLYEDSPDSLTINEQIRIERLSVARLYIENFNGIPVDEIMSRRRDANPEAYVYPESNSILKFETLTVNDRLETENLHLTFVHDTDGLENDREHKRKKIDHRFPRINDNYTIHSLKSDELFLGDLLIDNISGISIRHFISQRNNCFSAEINEKLNFHSEICPRLIIDGDALIKENLNVSKINEKSPKIYFDQLATEIFHVNSTDTFLVNNLTVHENVTINLFRGVSFATLYKNTLSKSRDQHLGNSKMSFFKIFVNDLNTEKINNRFTNHLIYIDSHEIKFEGDMTFTNLKISSLDPGSMPKIRTKYLNGYSTLNNEMVEKLGTVNARVINSLKVWGDVFWEESVNEGSENLSKFEAISRYSLLRNKTTPIVIRTNGPESTIIKSSNGVFVSRMKSKVKGTLRDQSGDTEIDIEKILGDCVLDDSSPLWPEKGEIRIGGKKTFRKDLKVARLTVLGEINIKKLNSWSIEDLNSSIVSIDFSRDDNMFSTKNASIIFRKGIKVKNLVILDSEKDLKVASSSLLVHGSPVDGIFTVTGLEGYDKILPHSTYLENLVVLHNAHVKYLDSVDLDDFLRNRVSLDSNSKTPVVVHGNIQFQGLIKVSENAWADLVNGVATADLVFNDTLEKQIISGEKTLVSGDLVIEGEAWAPVVAGINLTDAYNNAVLNGKPVEIFSDIIFESDVEKSSRNIYLEKSTDIILGTKDGFPGGFVNQVSMKNFSLEHDTMWENFISHLEEIKSELEARIARVSKIHLPEIFYYFEEENDLAISEAANVERVRVTKLEDSRILSLYTNDLGSACGLANECFCRKQYVAEISNDSNHCRTYKVHGPHRIYHFYEPNKAFALKVATTTVSTNERCTFFNNPTSSSYEPTNSEFTTISWMGNERDPLDPRKIKNDLKISGYLSDAAVFFENGLMYIVLAIYYDPIISTHETNSFVYVLDVESNRLQLAKQIPTSYAVGVEVFEIPNKGHHIFFSSYVDGKSTESVLYRLEKHSTEFRLLRRFMSGGNRHAKSVTQSEQQFLFLDDVETKSINVYRYDPQLDDYQHHQTIFHDSMAAISSIETFYTGDFRTSQAHVIVTTERDQFFVYKCNFMSKFEAIGRKKVDGIVSMVPFDVADRRYVFVGTDANSTILRIVEQGIGINMRNGRK